MNWKDWVNGLRILVVGGAVIYLARRLTRQQHRAGRRAAETHLAPNAPDQSD